MFSSSSREAVCSLTQILWRFYIRSTVSLWILPEPVSPLQVVNSQIQSRQINNWLHHHNTGGPFFCFCFSEIYLYFFSRYTVLEPPLKDTIMYLSEFMRTHTHTSHHTQCLVFRFIKPQCYPEWLTGWGTVQKSPPAGIHSHYHWEKASLISALVTARGGTTN